MRSRLHLFAGAIAALLACLWADAALALSSAHIEFVRNGFVYSAQTISSSGSSAQSAAAPDFGSPGGYARVKVTSGAVIVTPSGASPTATQTNGIRIETCSEPISIPITTGDKIAIIEATDANACASGGSLHNVETTTPLAGGATFTGTGRDNGAAAGAIGPWAYDNAIFNSDQAGTASLECSEDNTTWWTCATAPLVANTPLPLSQFVISRYFRPKLVNGATPQTVLHINSGMSGR